VNQPLHNAHRPAFKGLIGKLALASFLAPVAALGQQTTPFTTGNLVVAVEGCGVHGGTCTAVPNGTGDGTGHSSVGGYGDNQASPLTLFQYTPVGTTTATFVNSLALPQTAMGANFPVSAEYGSSSEANLQLSGSGQYLTIMGYGVNAAAFDANPTLFGAAPSNALGQSGSLTGKSYAAVPRVIALIDSNGTVTSTTALYNIFDTNNPRSIYTVDGTTAYVSGQGNAKDATGGVFYTALGAPNTTPTPITGLDTTNNTLSQDTRNVQIVNNTLYVSVDSKEGSNAARSYIGTLGTAGTPPTTTTSGGPVMLAGFGNTGGTGKISITKGADSTGNGLNTNMEINASPTSFFFANAYTLYVADSGNGKQTSADTTLGDGGLQKWTNTKSDGSGTWSLAYTLYKGLNLVVNTSASGTSGLFGLAGSVSGNVIQLYATNYTLTDLDPTFLYGITDNLTFTTASQASDESFNLLATAPADSNFKGVSFAPVVATKLMSTITWPAPAAITFGSALSTTQLNATANAAGTFAYSQPVGIVLPVGTNQALSVIFTPTDTLTYTTANASTTITVNAAAKPITPANLVVTKVLSRSGGNVLVTLTITNTGGTAATNAMLTSVKVGTASATPLPHALGTIAAGASAFATVTIPGSVGAAGAASSLTIGGTYTGATFNSSARIALP
jgi:hypothetical protein